MKFKFAKDPEGQIGVPISRIDLPETQTGFLPNPALGFVDVQRI